MKKEPNTVGKGGLYMKFFKCIPEWDKGEYTREKMCEKCNQNTNMKNMYSVNLKNKVGVLVCNKCIDTLVNNKDVRGE